MTIEIAIKTNPDVPLRSAAVEVGALFKRMNDFLAKNPNAKIIDFY